jgi:hypothetical protein
MAVLFGAGAAILLLVVLLFATWYSIGTSH